MKIKFKDISGQKLLDLRPKE